MIGTLGAAPPLRRLSRARTVMPLGDSITYGQGGGNGGYRGTLFGLAAADGKAFEYVGTQRFGPTSVNGVPMNPAHNGFPGYCISATPEPRLGLQEILPCPLFTVKPDIVLLHIGVNDLNYAPWIPTMISRLNTLLDTIVAYSPMSTIVLAQNTPYMVIPGQPGFDTYIAAIPGIVAARQAAGQLFRTCNMQQLDGNTEIADGIHPNDTGYAHMAAIWYAAIKDML